MATKKTTKASAEPAAKAAPKAAAPKAAAKKEPAKKAAPKAPAKKAAITERYTKSQIVAQLAEDTSLAKKDVNAVLDGLSELIELHIKKKGVGEFVLPGLFKVRTVKKAAKKARKGVNPFTGQETTFAARPASISVKVIALKKMKDMAN
jgi:nucleoid DNA-binding protein